MALTDYNKFVSEFKAPSFVLPEIISGKTFSFPDSNQGNANVIMFICNHCPYVKHIIDGVVDLADEYIPKGIKFVSVSSNDAAKYPADSPEMMKHFAAQHEFSFPYLYDESQNVARAYQAECTPDIYIFNSELICVYHGQFDGSRPGNNVPVTGSDVRAALDAILAGETVSANQIPGIGCNIKWK